MAAQARTRSDTVNSIFIFIGTVVIAIAAIVIRRRRGAPQPASGRG
jgi:LPXTG-motif cell wall-anchored protein